MEYLYSKIISLPVFAADSLRPLCTIRDILMDPESGKVVAFLVDLRKGLIITVNDIVAVKHGIWIRESEDIIPIEDMLRADKVYKDYGSFFKKKVRTENGKSLGVVVDMTIDEHSFILNKLYVAKGFAGIVQFDARIIPAKNIIEVTRDKIVVKNDEGLLKESALVKEEESQGVIAEPV